jgi:hypothetical protein
MYLEGRSDVADDVLVREDATYQQGSSTSRGASDLTRIMGRLGLVSFIKASCLGYLLQNVTHIG